PRGGRLLLERRPRTRRAPLEHLGTGGPRAGAHRRARPVQASGPKGTIARLEPVSRGQVEMIGRELAARVRGLEPPELDPEHQRPAGAEIHVPLAHEVLEPAPRVAERVGQIAVVGIVDAAAAADHHLPSGPDIDLTPATLGADLLAGRPQALADPTAAQSRQRLSAERLRQELDRAGLDARVRRDGAR